MSPLASRLQGTKCLSERQKYPAIPNPAGTGPEGRGGFDLLEGTEHNSPAMYVPACAPPRWARVSR